MEKPRAKIFNERVKTFSGVVNTLASAVMILGVLRPQIEASASGPVVNLQPDVNILWVTVALIGYLIGWIALGLMKDEDGLTGEKGGQRDV